MKVEPSQLAPHSSRLVVLLLPSCTLVSVWARSVLVDNSFAAFPFPFVPMAIGFDYFCPSDVNNLQFVTEVPLDPEVVVFRSSALDWV